ncbi:RNA-binding protein [Methylobacterium sp. E-005]|uniref:RNA-binding protein n=1 Tax=Methylobacterium sp. E-005 TaxID=2836549 RepID=UPI001FBA1683|nr:RNA-binding protein [Methylobacterium sp. E-005]MCJ2089756.1 RNA-binding protein [Methylobacterium sp. E-005]
MAKLMPTGPKGQHRLDDAIGNAIRVAQIATGEAQEDYGPEKPPKDEGAAAMGRKGAAARATAMTPERRAEIARGAASKRWQGND